MEIQFSSNRLKRELNESRTMERRHGRQRSRILKIIMNSLRAAANLGEFAPPYSPPHRCHELKGNRKGQFSLDLDGPYRLLFKPIGQYNLTAGTQNWHAITAITVIGVKDTHG